MKKRKSNTFLYIVIALCVLTIILIPMFFSFKTGNVALIPIKGTIVADGTPSMLGQELTSAEEVVAFIEEANQDPNIQAIVLDINSPGGSAVASDEIAEALKRTEKPTVAVIHEVGASGGYWIASATDQIISNRMSIVGSIGVISSYLEISQLLENYNVTYQRLVAGKYKDVGTPFKELTEEERNILQIKLDKIHDFFIDAVAENRNMPRENVAAIATGEIFLGTEALDLGLIDQLGNTKTAEEYLIQNFGLEEINYVSYESRPSLLSALTQTTAPFFYYIGIGMGQSLFDTTDTLGIRV
ncbi:signal peptide peptidase SppA [Nanoarchaeota archaeon]